MTVDDLARGLNEKQQVDAILLDFSKAFDKVPHQRLLHKLQHYKWIEDFLYAITLEVVIEGTKSTPSPVSSGVPQGTVLDPLMFLAYSRVEKANSTMAFLRRNIRSASQQAKSTAYKTFVRPTLEYASTVSLDST